MNREVDESGVGLSELIIQDFLVTIYCSFLLLGLTNREYSLINHREILQVMVVVIKDFVRFHCH